MLDADLAERVDDRIDEGGRGTDRPRFAGALDAERVGPARHDIVGELDRRQVLGAGQAVIGQRAGQQLSGLGVKNRSLEHCLANSLCDAALHLSSQQ